MKISGGEAAMMRWRCSNGGADVMIMVRGYGGCANISGCGGWACRCSNGGRVDVSNGGTTVVVGVATMVVVIAVVMMV